MSKVNTFCLKMEGLRAAVSELKALEGRGGYRVGDLDYNLFSGVIRVSVCSYAAPGPELIGSWIRIKRYDKPATMQEIAVDIYKKVVK